MGIFHSVLYSFLRKSGCFSSEQFVKKILQGLVQEFQIESILEICLVSFPGILQKFNLKHFQLPCSFSEMKLVKSSWKQFFKIIIQKCYEIHIKIHSRFCFFFFQEFLYIFSWIMDITEYPEKRLQRIHSRTCKCAFRCSPMFYSRNLNKYSPDLSP